jgi:predicted  nucleic acid-binding Zn-ribbon protein
MRPQVFQELRMGIKVFHCESCRRILYFQQKEQTAAT